MNDNHEKLEACSAITMATEKVLLPWNELLPIIGEDEADGDRCPILTF